MNNFVNLYKELHDDNNCRKENVTLLLLPVKNAQNKPVHWLDFINGGGAYRKGNNFFIASSSNFITIEGWAVDGLNDSTASLVIIEVGNEYILANYGKKRESVVDFFKNANFLNSGYYAILNAKKVIDAHGFIVHIISADETYRYEPLYYYVHKYKKFQKHLIFIKNAIKNVLRETNLYLHAVNINTVYKMFRGKSVAIVGNAQSLFDYKFGAEIDTHDVVIRMNMGYKIKQSESQGVKTSILTVCDNIKLNKLYEDKPEFRFLCLIGNEIVKYSLPRYPFKNKFFVYPKKVCMQLKKTLDGNYPSSGAQMIFFVLLSGVKKIDLYGFDFLKTHTFYAEERTFPIPHDFNKEEDWALELTRNGNVTIHGNDSKTRNRVIKKRVWLDKD